ncbi:MAG: class I SAM-dependent methyltransferase [Bacteroidota bacterium]
MNRFIKKTTKKKDFKEFYNSTIFSKIYRTNGWGGKKGEFYSGSGSHNPSIKGYTKAVANFILENNVHDIVEIGCGDFNVSNGILTALNEVKRDYNYTGYDVVKPLIARNRALFSSSKINFVCKDSSVGNIKSGDLLIIRQVLQHLNNKSIGQIAAKFKNYKYIIFTEHQASEKYGNAIAHNKDQVTGKETRLANRSGVYLDREPFNCRIEAKLFAINEWVYGLDANINTYLVKNITSKQEAK